MSINVLNSEIKVIPAGRNTAHVNVLKEIENEVKENKVMIYMKGTPNQPLCGFSARCSEILKSFHVPFAAVDVIADNEKREAIKVFTSWPTIPQIFIEGEFVGGCDILSEIYESGELEAKLKKAFQI